MTANRLFITLWIEVITCGLLVGCTSAPGGNHAPVVEYGIKHKHSVDTNQDQKNTSQNKKIEIHYNHEEVTELSYEVQKGDTLYSIAFFHGVDYREVAKLNGLTNPAAIKIGQKLRLLVPVPGSSAKPVEDRSISALQNTPQGGVKNQPKVGKIPYSSTAMAQAERMQNDQADMTHNQAAEIKPSIKSSNVVENDDETLEWGMPTSGKVITEYSENTSIKGVDIAGKKGQPVVASASGKVVYCGNGLRGYGKLIIIKHNKIFLSAYAHNDLILVKEGQSVSKGQKIAEMGNTDADQVKLHFEIRKLGKPVDPSQYLPLVKF